MARICRGTNIYFNNKMYHPRRYIDIEKTIFPTNKGFYIQAMLWTDYTYTKSITTRLFVDYPENGISLEEAIDKLVELGYLLEFPPDDNTTSSINLKDFLEGI